MIPPFRTFQTGDSGTDRLASDIEKTLSAVTDVKLLAGTLLETIAVGTTPTAVSHKLGYKPRGWFVVDADVAASLYRASSDASFLTLVASAPVTVSLWVF